MDPFHVICETCHARLKIRSESVIGQIHACPKCESMVQIVPPPGWLPASVPIAADSSAFAPLEVTSPELPAIAAGSSMLVWSIGGAALVLVAGLAAVMWPRGDERVSAPSPEVVAAADPATATPDSPVAESPAENPVIHAVIDDVSDEHAAQLPPDDASEAKPNETAATTPALPELPADDPAVAAPAATAASDAPASTPPQPDPNTRKPVLKFDPLDFDASQLSLGGATPSPSAETSGSVADSNLAPAVTDVGNDLPDDPVPVEPAAGDPSVTVRIGPASTDALRPRNVAEQLALKIESFDMPAMPLARFADIVAEMADVPITLDPAALAMAGVSPRANVAVQARNTTLDKLLRDALAKQRLDYVARDGQVVIIQPNGDRRRSVDYEVKDLLEPGAADAAAIADLIQRLVTPESWQAGANGGTIRVDGSKLHVDQVNSIQIQILVFCERLRLARGLAPRSRYPADRLSIDSPNAKLSAVLGKPTTFTFLPWTRLADVVRQWQASTGVTILVDWPALAQEELAPSTPIACSAINRPWDAALDAVLEPLGLAWWTVDGETIQITSRTALASIERIEFYIVPKPMREKYESTDALVDAIQNEQRIRGNAPDGVALNQTRIEFDGPSGRLIVMAPPTIHRYLSQRFIVLTKP